MFGPQINEVFHVPLPLEALPEGAMIEGLQSMDDMRRIPQTQYRWRYGGQFGTWKDNQRTAIAEAWSMHGGARSEGRPVAPPAGVELGHFHFEVPEGWSVPKGMNITAILLAGETVAAALARLGVRREQGAQHVVDLAAPGQTDRTVMSIVSVSPGADDRIGSTDFGREMGVLREQNALLEESLRRARASEREVRDAYDGGCTREQLQHLHQVTFGAASATAAEVLAAAAGHVAKRGELEARLASAR